MRSKKVICVILSLIMALGLMATSVTAQTVVPSTTGIERAIEEAKLDALRQEVMQQVLSLDVDTLMVISNNPEMEYLIEADLLEVLQQEIFQQILTQNTLNRFYTEKFSIVSAPFVGSIEGFLYEDITPHSNCARCGSHFWWSSQSFCNFTFPAGFCRFIIVTSVLRCSCQIIETTSWTLPGCGQWHS